MEPALAHPLKRIETVLGNSEKRARGPVSWQWRTTAPKRQAGQTTATLRSRKQILPARTSRGPSIDTESGSTWSNLTPQTASGGSIIPREKPGKQEIRNPGKPSRCGPFINRFEEPWPKFELPQ